MTFKILLTGGGTAGHVIPHVALLKEMRALSWDISYIGTKGMEKALIQAEGVPFYTISAGKLRRYFSFQNFLDIFKCFLGLLQSLFFLVRLRPHLVFSKGGYVSVPVCVAAWLLRIPVVTHESDVTPGLANKIILKFATKVFYSFAKTQKYLPKDAECFSLPVRDELFEGSSEVALQRAHFSSEDKRPVMMVMGGSQGALVVNQLVEKSFEDLAQNFRVIHLTGKGKKSSLPQSDSYFQQEYAREELKDFLALSDLIVSRSGANSLFEFKALEKPMLLIPLAQGSRGDQILNAECFQEEGLALMAFEKDLDPKSFVALCLKAQKLSQGRTLTSSLQEKAKKHQEEKKHFLNKLFLYRKA